METSKEKKRRGENYIPIEIVRQILEHLPIKSLLKLKSTSKLWFLLINEIVNRRLLEKISQKMKNLHEIHQNLISLIDEMKLLMVDNAYRNAHLVYELRDRVNGKLDDMVSLMDFDEDDDDEYVDRCIDEDDYARDAVNSLAGHAEELQDAVDELMVSTYNVIAR